jgi:hypothetical protein
MSLCSPRIIIALDVGSSYFGTASVRVGDPVSIGCSAPTIYVASQSNSSLFVDADTGYVSDCMALMVARFAYLKSFTLSGTLDIPEDQILWVVPVSTSRGHRATTFLRQAALQARLVEYEHSNKLLLVPEPEAASLGIWDSLPEVNLLQEGDRFLTLHCGGSLIEIVVYEVVNLSPPSLKAVSTPVSLMAAGESVWSNFLGFLMTLLGEQNYHERVCGLKLIHLQQSFARMSEFYDPRDEPGRLVIADFLATNEEGVKLMLAYNATHQDHPLNMTASARNGAVFMPRELMLSFYEPCLSAMVSAIHSTLADVPSITQILMTGGFSDSKVVQQRVMQEFHLQYGGVRVALPPMKVPGHTSAASLAVARGAVLYAQSRSTNA